MGKEYRRSLGVIDLILMNLVAIISLRWIAAAAQAGPKSLLLWPVAAVCFFLPQAFAVTWLSRRDDGEGGLYRWTKEGFGNLHGYLCGWCYWVNNLFYIPSLLIFAAGNLGLAFRWLNDESNLGENRIFIVVVTIGLLTLTSLLNFLGFKFGKWLDNIAGITTWIPAAILIGLGVSYVFNVGSANEINSSTIFLNQWTSDDISLFSKMCFSFSGYELATFLTRDIKNGGKTIARSIIPSALLILIVYTGGTLAALFAVPVGNINPINGLLLPIAEASQFFSLSYLPVLCAGCIAMGAVGGTIAWFGGAARIPYIAGIDKYLPSSFAKVHSYFQTPYVAIVAQTVFAALFTLMATAGKATRVDTAYYLLVDMSIILYFIPYLYLFLCLHRFAGKESKNRWRSLLFSILGLGSTILAIVLSLIPPSGSSFWPSFAKTLGGAFVMIGLGFILYFRKKA